MKYGLGIKLIISFLVGGIAVLYKLRLNPIQNKSEISKVINVPKKFVFDFVTKTSNVPIYFSWVKQLYEVDTRKNLTVGKTYRGTLDLPFLGQHEIRYSISDFQHGGWVVLKPDAMRGSYFKTEVIIMVNSITATDTQFYMKITYHRDSALFRLTLAPFLKILTDTQLVRLVDRVYELTTSKWKIWQNTPTPKAVATNSTKSRSRVVFKEGIDPQSHWARGESRKRKNKK